MGDSQAGARRKGNKFISRCQCDKHWSTISEQLRGSGSRKRAFIEEKVQEWCRDLKQLSDIASKEPQIGHSAYVYGLRKKWNYVCRTTPGVADRLTPLEQVTCDEFINLNYLTFWCCIKITLIYHYYFIPAIINRLFSCTDELRNIMALPPRYVGFKKTTISRKQQFCLISIIADKNIFYILYN